MARHVDRLSARGVAVLKKPGYHADGLGLYLIVDDNLAKRWSFIFQWDGKRKEMGFGALHDVGLADARLKRTEARKLVAAGLNPIEERKRPPQIEVIVKTFAEIAQEVIDAIPQDKRRKSWQTALSASQALWLSPIDTIDTDAVLDALRTQWTAHPIAAAKLRGRIEKVLDVAAAKLLRAGPNPARWKGHLELFLTRPPRLVKGHHPALPYGEMPGFMAALGANPSYGARPLELTILTVLRTSECLGGRKEEVNRKTQVWTIPGERMKGGKEHRVPLSDAAYALIPEGDEGFMFPGFREGRPLSNMVMEMVLRRMGRDDITVHGFRSSFRDWAGEETEFPREIVEQALAHVVGTEVERAYRRGDALERRRKLMVAWAAHCYPALR